MAFDIPLSTPLKQPSVALAMFRERVVDKSGPDQLIRASHDSSTVVREMFRLLKSGQFNIKAKPKVMFTNEAGIDADGLTRELCHMVMASIQDGKGGVQLFEGKRDHLIPVHNEEYIASHYFEYVGKLIAHSVIHAGFGFVGLSRAITMYLISEDVDSCLTHLSVEDIPDFELQTRVKEVIV